MKPLSQSRPATQEFAMDGRFDFLEDPRETRRPWRLQFCTVRVWKQSSFARDLGFGDGRRRPTVTHTTHFISILRLRKIVIQTQVFSLFPLLPVHKKIRSLMFY